MHTVEYRSHKHKRQEPLTSIAKLPDEIRDHVYGVTKPLNLYSETLPRLSSI